MGFDEMRSRRWSVDAAEIIAIRHSEYLQLHRQRDRLSHHSQQSSEKVGAQSLYNAAGWTQIIDEHLRI
jgi:hypothetical protein